MSPKNEVLPLNFLCLKYVSNILIHVLSDDEGKNYTTVERYLLDATFEVIQDLLKLILNTENLDASTRFSCLHVLLREDVRRVDTGVFPHSYYEKIMEILKVKCGSLQHLNLKGVWVREHPNLLSDLLTKLKYLRVLIMPHIPDDLVLETTVKLSKLSVLDISGECAFSENALRKLRSNSINILYIGMYGKKEICQNGDSTEVMADVILQLPNLNVLKTYSFTGSALLKLYKKMPEYKTKLIYIHDTDTDKEILEAIVHLCPKLQSVNFNNPQDGVLCSLGRLKCLNSLKLSRPVYRDLTCYLAKSGGRLQVLKLNLIKENRIDVSAVCMYAPELQTLECFKLNLCCLQPDNYFMNLHTVEILYCDVSANVLRYLLMNTPFLRRIVVGDVIMMTDGDIFRLCADCEFQCLEELWFSSARCLTATSVELLMGHCRNLRVLGQLSGWDVTPNDMDYLRTLIMSCNLDLTLLPVGVFP
ncbi:f-box/tpr repeat protein pof3 [Holotrichia oblita]|uniref:F-box/tpr repeat protein pof3 n=1 Tax=Holotrichia oblita TaxID=644536 RepID=A0ACB9SUV2_HOLOL|nr:f-box/tpr repeat protein pof3 [Holotrichia oblita]